MLPKVFIDGHTGTTGLRIHQWMARREDIELLTLPEELRRNAEERRGQIEEADVAILCLPDDAAEEVAGWVAETDTRLIDASTAHRVADGWAYGLPELEPSQRGTIQEAKLVSNPGCYPTGFILLVRPLIDAGLVPADAPISVNALSGYSGGGNSLISKWENPENELDALPFEAPYALYQRHKHIPEMMKYAGVAAEPQFLPSVGPFRCGMRVQVPIHASLLRDGATGEQIWETLYDRYQGEKFVDVAHLQEPGSLNEKSFDPESCNDSNRIELHVAPHPSGHVLLVALLDNLGKGACGAAIQNLNVMLGHDEEAGLPSRE